MTPGAKKNLKNILFVPVALVLSIILATGLMILVYLIPTDRIRDNIISSGDIYDREGLTNYYNEYLVSSRMDNYTDSVMQAEAAYDGDENVVVKALQSKYHYLTDMEDYTSPGYINKLMMHGEDTNSIVASYARYWHGYLLLLKPLFLVINMHGMRILNGAFQILMLAAVLFGLVRKGQKKLIAPLLVSILVINPVSTILNMQFACMYNITLVLLVIMLYTKISEGDGYWKLFLFSGIATAFFDFLTYPLISLGIPLVLMICLRGEKSSDNIRTTFFSCINWGIGYAVMWASKWVVCDLVTGSNVIEDAIHQVSARTVTNAYDEIGLDSTNIISVFGYNFIPLRDIPMVALFVLSVIALVLYMVFAKKKIKICEESLIALLLIALIPFAWYAVLSNHSAVHYWMTYRNLTVMIFSLGTVIMSSVVNRVPAGGKGDVVKQG
ncbi:MAG: hypothetical protein IKE53_00515 [Clostridiales bacterium]|nr:hypothetical protein [Clostridiales bacterium]